MPPQGANNSAPVKKNRATRVADGARGRVLRLLGARQPVGRLLDAHRLVGIAAVIATVGALCAPSGAQAAYEQVPEHFGTQGEAAQLAESHALAVNQTGAGGVPPGTFYVVGPYNRVVRYSPGKEGEEPQFAEAWGWEVGVGSGDEYARCGPAYTGTASAAEGTYEKCTPLGTFASGQGFELPGHFILLGSVAVDQTTGDVYVRSETTPDGSGPRQHHLIEVLSATGKPIGEGFGDAASGTSSPPESIAESPEKLHRTPNRSAIAVNASGTVYLTDSDYVGVEHPQNRVLSFEPCVSGDYEHYCYAAGKDFPIQEIPTKMSLVGSNRVVVASEGLIDEYPVGGSSVAPVCNLKVSGQLQAMTTNELTGEVLYFTFHDHSIHRMAPCDETSGTFTEDQTLKPTPQAVEITALGVAPSLIWGPLRPPGVLYAVNARPVGIGDVFASVPASIAPTVGAELTTNTASTSTVLEAQISPHGFPVSYYFEYLNQADYLANGESFEGPHPPARAPAGAGELEGGVASAVVTGLDPETEYRFRVIASSQCNGPEHPGCVSTGPAARFATYPATSGVLPDGRIYELVSPIEKHGGEVIPAFPTKWSCDTECKPPGLQITTTFPVQSTSDGDAVAYMGYAFSPSEGAAVFNSYVSRRSGSDWQTTAMTPALFATKGGKYFAYSADLTEAVIDPGGTIQLSPLAPTGHGNFYLLGGPAPSAATPLLTTAPPHRTGIFEITYAGHSADFKAQFFSANDALTRATPYAPEPPDPGASGSDLYEWRGGSLALVNVLPGNAAVAGGGAFVSESPDANGVAADGRRVFWAAGGHVYVREDGQITRELRHPGTFLSASENGEEVLFSDGCLYSLLTEACTDLTQGKGGFKGVAGSTGDLSRIYFVDKAALTSEAEAGTCEVAAGSDQHARTEESEGKVPRGLGCNLYAYEQGVGSTLVTTLLASDDSAGSELHDWASASGERTAEASSDGRYLAFVSRAQLTSYGNIGRCDTNENATGVVDLREALCGEVFLYDAATKRVLCASCDPTGEAPRGNSFLPLIEVGGNFPQPRYLSDRGRLFFDSQDRLSAADVNGRAEDVYEEEPSGVGSCTRTVSCVSLISPGSGSYDSNFLAMGGEGEREGGDVFFTTRERLVPADKDELIDVYDARVEGGLASEAEGQPGGCVGETCQATSSAPAAIFGAPMSMTFSGAGNLTPPAPVAAKPKPLTRAQKLTKALRSCRSKKSRAGRLACGKAARQKYRAKHKPGKNASAKAQRRGK